MRRHLANDWELTAGVYQYIDCDRLAQNTHLPCSHEFSLIIAPALLVTLGWFPVQPGGSATDTRAAEWAVDGQQEMAVAPPSPSEVGRQI